jgi:Domain of unknown function (DUF4372)
MALIPLGLGRFADGPDATRHNAVRHQNSVFHGLLNHIPWDVFDRLVGEHGADSRVRRLNTKSQFVALLYGQLSGAASLREIVTGLASHAARLYHLGVRPVQRSTLVDDNAGRPSAMFAELFAELVKRAHRDPAHTPGGSLAVEILPCPDHRLARLDTRDTSRRQFLGGDPAFGDLPGGLARGPGAKVEHRDLHRLVRTVSEPIKRR